MFLAKVFNFVKVNLKTKPVVFLLLALAIFLSYSNVFPNQLVGDDPDFIQNWQEVKDFKHIPQLLSGSLPSQHQGTYRPIRSLLYLITQYLFDENVFYYHLFSLLVHLVASFLVYEIIYKISQKQRLAWIAALLFALHPIHTEAITFITTSFDEFGTMMGLLSFYLFLGRKDCRYFYLLSIFFGLWAIFNYEVMLVLPALMFLYLVYFGEKSLPATPKLSSSQKIYFLLNKSRSITPIIPFIAIILFYFILRIVVFHIPSRGNYIGGNLNISLILAVRTIPTYIWESFFPWHLSLDHQIGFNTYTYNLPQYVEKTLLPINIFDTYNFISILTIISLLLIILSKQKKQPLLSFGIAWILITLTPTLNLFPGYLIMFEKYLYLPSVGSCLVMAYFFDQYWNKKIKNLFAIRLIFAIFLIWFSLATFIRNFDWHDEISIWQKTVDQSPYNAMVWYKAGGAYQHDKQYEKARDCYLQALKLNNDMYFVHTNLGTTYYYLKDTQKAMVQLQTAIDQYDKAKDALYFMAKIYYDFQDFNQAILYLEKTLIIDPEYDDAKKLLVETYTQQGILLAQYREFDKAIEFFQKSLGIDPNYQPALTKIQSLQSK